MPGLAFVQSLPQALQVVKELKIQPPSWEDQDWRRPVRDSVANVMEEQMALAIDRHLEEVARQGGEDRRNGVYTRHLLTEMGDIELSVPRTRTFSAVKIIHQYARRTPEVDRLILACFVLGLSTRKVGQALCTILGERISPTLVSRVAKALDVAVLAFHQRPLSDKYVAILFDGVILSRKTGAGAVRRPVLVALGLLPDGKKEIIDFLLASSESQAEWERFLSRLYRRGLKGAQAKIICSDGGNGLLAALPTVYPDLPVQRCWAHKMRNILDKFRKADRVAAKKGLHAIYRAEDLPAARHAARRWADRWQSLSPKAVACLRNDLDELLTFFHFKDPQWRVATRTTNAIERRFVEVRRRTRPMGVFSDKTSMDRILYAVFTNENRNQGLWTPVLLTHNS